MLVAVDVGNSSVKLGAFEGPLLRAATRLAVDDLAAFGHLGEPLGIDPAQVSAVACVSVNDAVLEALLSGPGRGALVLGRDLPIPVENRYRAPAEVGSDRLANAAAAHDRAGGAAIAVDVGSAVTVDAVSADGAFLGGPIAPGAPAFASGLHASAPALPAWSGEEPEPGMPASTAEAIRFGVVHGLAGLVERLVALTAAAMGEGSPPVFLTGGDAGLVAPRVTLAVETVPHLTLEGVRILYDRARR